MCLLVGGRGLIHDHMPCNLVVDRGTGPKQQIFYVGSVPLSTTEIVFVYFTHIKSQKASFNSNRDIRFWIITFTSPSFEFRKKNTKNHFRNIVFVYIAHAKFQKASYNSNSEIRHNVAKDGGDGRHVDRTHFSTSCHFSKTGRR